MLKAMRVEIDNAGHVHPLEPAESIPEGRAVLTWPTPQEEDAMSLSERSLAEDWLRPEEDAAWAQFQKDK